MSAEASNIALNKRVDWLCKALAQSKLDFEQQTRKLAGRDEQNQRLKAALVDRDEQISRVERENVALKEQISDPLAIQASSPLAIQAPSSPEHPVCIINIVFYVLFSLFADCRRARPVSRL